MPAGVPRRRTKNLAEREIAEWNRQRTETQRQLAEKYRLENQIKRGEYLNRAELEKAFAQLADALGQVVGNSRAGQKVERGFVTRVLATCHWVRIHAFSLQLSWLSSQAWANFQLAESPHSRVGRLDA